MSLILGIHSGHESSTALFRDGRLIAAVSEERLSRIKNDGGRLPNRAIDLVLSLAGATRADVDHLALLYTFFPEKYVLRENLAKRIERSWAMRRKQAKKEQSQILAGHLLQRLASKGKTFDQHFLKEKFLSNEGFTRATANFYDHHDAHAWPAAFYSGFNRTAVITMDGVGDFHINHTSCTWQDGRLTRHHASQGHGTSAGEFYSNITTLLGFTPLRHEGKITGLAAFGDPNLLYGAFSEALRLSPDGHTLDSAFANKPGANEQRLKFLATTIQGCRREDVAAAAQQVLEDVVVELIRRFLDETGMEYIALNGGVFANVKLNQRIAALPGVKGLFVFPGMSDTGNSVGAALMELQSTNPAVFSTYRMPLDTVYLGPEFTMDGIQTILESTSVPYRRLEDEILIRTAAAAIHAGKVVGWFQGRMEFGPRSLGNRSMLARPTKADINDWLNTRLERSEFMPFAPSILEEHADDVLIGVEKARHTAEFMTITFDVRPHWRDRIAAVVHVDGTARPQMVSKRTNPLYHRLISAYHELSGIPLVLNTSFNVHEEPIVCAPREAVRAFVERRVDCLAIGPFWLEHP